MAVSADATFSGTVLLCPFSLEQPHDIADGMYVQVSAAPLTGCLAVEVQGGIQEASSGMSDGA